MCKEICTENKIKLFALDLDGTSLAPDGAFSPLMHLALQKAAENGIAVAAASGRALHALPDCVRRAPEIRYAITSNGAAVYDLQTGEKLCAYTLSPAAAEQVLQIMETEKGAFVEYTVEGQAYAPAEMVRAPEKFGRTAKAADYVRRTRKPSEHFFADAHAHIGELDCIDAYCASKEAFEALLDRVQKIDGLYTTSSFPNMLEISDARAGKANALQYLCRQLHIHIKETAAFGNADNDSAMLLESGCGIAVRSASPACKAAADFLTGDPQEDGAAKAMLQLMQNQKEDKI